MKTFFSFLSQFKGKYLYLASNFLVLVPVLVLVTCAFSLVKSAYFESLPYQNVNRLYVVDGIISNNGTEFDGRNPNLQQLLLEESSDIEEIASYHQWSDYRLRDHQDQLSVTVRLATNNLFSMLGIKPLYGRLFTEEESLGKKSQNSLLGHELREKTFKSDPNIIGKTLQLNNRNFTVVGVLPKHFILPGVYHPGDSIWIPIDSDDGYRPGLHRYAVMGEFKSISKLKHDIADSHEDVENRLTAIAKQVGLSAMHESFLQSTNNMDFRVEVSNVKETLLGETGRMASLTFIACMMILMIALINLSTMHYADALAKSKKNAIKSVMSASPATLFKEHMIKNTTLMMAILFFSSIASYFLIDTIRFFLGDIAPWAESLSMGMLGFIFLCLSVLAICALYSCIDVKSIVHGNLIRYLSGSGKGNGQQVSSLKFQVLIAIQVFLSFCILIASGHLAVKMLSKLPGESGFKHKNVWTATINFSDIKNKKERKVLFDTVMNEFGKHSDIEYLTSASESILVSQQNIFSTYNELQQSTGSARIIDVDVDYFDVLGLSFLVDDHYQQASQALIESDQSVYISKKLADSFELYGKAAVGEKIAIFKPNNLLRVKGVVNETSLLGGIQEDYPVVYRIKAYSGSSKRSIVVRSNGNNNKINTFFLNKVKAIDSRLVLEDIQLLTDNIDEIKVPVLFSIACVSVLLLTSFILVCVGVYGICSFMLQKQINVIGIKLSIGASKIVAIIESIKSLAYVIAMSVWLAFFVSFFSLCWVKTYPSFNITPSLSVFLLTVLSISIATFCAFLYSSVRLLAMNPIQSLRE